MSCHVVSHYSFFIYRILLIMLFSYFYLSFYRILLSCFYFYYYFRFFYLSCFILHVIHLFFTTFIGLKARFWFKISARIGPGQGPQQRPNAQACCPPCQHRPRPICPRSARPADPSARASPHGPQALFSFLLAGFFLFPSAWPAPLPFLAHVVHAQGLCLCSFLLYRMAHPRPGFFSCSRAHHDVP